jgi:hypothetical protein
LKPAVPRTEADAISSTSTGQSHNHAIIYEMFQFCLYGSAEIEIVGSKTDSRFKVIPFPDI